MTLIHDFIYVPLPNDDVCRRLVAHSCAWLGPLATDAVHEAERLVVRLGPFAGLTTVGKTFEVTTEAPVHRREATLVPITWRATGAPHLFPVMTGDLEIAPLGADLTQITLQGRYEPPFGAAGRGLDRLLLHRVAHATVRSFLHRMQTGLMAPEGASQPADDKWQQLLGVPRELVPEE